MAWLSVTHQFNPVAIEISEVIGPGSLEFLRTLVGWMVRQETGNKCFLIPAAERIRVLQWGNTVSIVGALMIDKGMIVICQLIDYLTFLEILLCYIGNLFVHFCLHIITVKFTHICMVLAWSSVEFTRQCNREWIWMSEWDNRINKHRSTIHNI